MKIARKITALLLSAVFTLQGLPFTNIKPLETHAYPGSIQASVPKGVPVMIPPADKSNSAAAMETPARDEKAGVEDTAESEVVVEKALAEPQHIEYYAPIQNKTVQAQVYEIQEKEKLEASIITLSQKSGMVTLKWNIPKGAKTYNVKRGIAPGKLENIASGLMVNTYEDKIPDVDQTYFYAVEAQKDEQKSVNSNLCNTTPALETPVLTAEREEGKIKISWTYTFGADNYTLSKSTSKAGPYTAIIQNTTENYYEDTAITEKSTYYYKIAAASANGSQSEVSDTLEVLPLVAEDAKFDPQADDDGDGVSNKEELKNASDVKGKEDNNTAEKAVKPETAVKPELKGSKNAGLQSQQVSKDEVKKASSATTEKDSNKNNKTTTNSKTNYSTNNKVTTKTPDKKQETVVPPENTKVSKKTTRTVKGKDNKTQVDIKGDDTLKTADIKIEKAQEKHLSKLKGIVGEPLEITAGGVEINSAIVTIPYDRNKLGDVKEDQLKIYWVDKENGKLVPLSNIQIDKKNQVVRGTTSHFSTYILGGQMEVDLRQIDFEFVIDRSKGMAQADANNSWKMLLETFYNDLPQLNTDGTPSSYTFRLAAVQFSDFAEEKIPLTYSRKEFDAVANTMDKTIGSSNLVDALWVGQAKLTQDPQNTRRKVMVLVSDGRDTCGNSDTLITNILQTIQGKNIVIYTVAVGPDANRNLMQLIAEKTGGDYYSIDTSGTSIDDLKAQAASIFDKIAKQIYLRNITQIPQEYQDKLRNKLSEEIQRGTDYEEALKNYTGANANLLTGNYCNVQTDIKLESTGNGVFLQRTYNSDAWNKKTVVGNGWSLNYETSLEVLEPLGYGKITATILNVRELPDVNSSLIAQGTMGITVKITGPAVQGGDYKWYPIAMQDGGTGYVAENYIEFLGGMLGGARINYGSGTIADFPRDNDVSSETKIVYKSPYGIYDTLIAQNGFYYLTKKDLTKYVYEPAGENKYRLQSIIDKHGNGINLSYTDGKVTSVTDGLGRSLTLSYKDNMLWKVTDPLSRTVEYIYDTAGNLVSVVDPEGKKTSYTYYEEKKSTEAGTEIVTSRRLKQIIDANEHQVIKNEYDIFGRLITQYDANNNAKYHMYRDILKDSTGQDNMPGYDVKERYYIDENGGELRVKYNPVTNMQVLVADAKGNNTENSYFVDLTGEGREWSDITNICEGTPLFEAYKTMQKAGNTAKREVTKDKNGYTTDTEYDSRNNVVKVTDANNDYIINEYTQGNNIAKQIDKKGNATIYTYLTKDSYGLTYEYLDTVTDAAGNTSKYEYYDLGTDIQISGLVKKVTQSVKNKNGEAIEGFKATEYKYADGYNNRTEIIDSMGNHTFEVYDAAGRLTQLKDRNGNITKYTYDKNNRLIAEEDALGYINKINYDNVGNKRYLTDKNNNTTEFVYDARNQLIKTIDANGNTVEYKYNALGKKIYEKNQKGGITRYSYDILGRLTKTIDPMGFATEYQYDVDNEDANDPNRKNNVIVTQRLSNAKGDDSAAVTVTQYDSLYRKLKERAKYTENGTAKELVTTYSYDKNGNIANVVKAVGTDMEVATKYTYDSLNRQTAVTEGAGLGGVLESTVTIEYDAVNDVTLGKLTVEITKNQLDQKYKKEYNSLGQLVRETNNKNEVTLYTYDPAGNLKTKKEAITEEKPTGKTTNYEFDKLNRVSKITDTMGYSTSTEYDAVGNKIKEIDKRGKAKEYLYSKLNQLQTIVETAAIAILYTYDQAGNLSTVTDAEKNVTTRSYNLKNQLIAETDGEGKTTYIKYNGVGNKIFVSTKSYPTIGTSYQYNELGYLLKTTNAEGDETSYTYDAKGNVLTESAGGKVIKTNTYDKRNRLLTVAYAGDETIPALTQTNTYDVIGNLKETSNSMDKVTINTYDELNRIIKETTQKSDGTQAITKEYTYDLSGNKASEKIGGDTTNYMYDYQNRLVFSKVIVNGVEHISINNYDANGNLLTASDWRSNIITNEYDALNRLTQKKDQYGVVIQKNEYNNNSLQTKGYDADGNITSYSYDKEGRLVLTIDPLKHESVQSYNADGNISTKTDGNKNQTSYVYDGAGRLINVVNANNEITSYVYDSRGNVVMQEDGNGNKTTYHYNVANKLAAKLDNGGLGVPERTESYTYYADGSLATKTDRNGNTTTYTYDIHGRLINETVGEISISYTYDDKGNQLTVTDSTGTTVRTYDALNRVTSKTVPNIGTSTYVYDIIAASAEWGIKDGYMEAGYTAEGTIDPKGNKTVKIFDKAGRLKIVLSDGQATWYSYNKNGSRLSVDYPGGAREEYTYYADGLLRTLTNKNTDGSVIETYTYTYDASHNQISKTDAKGESSYIYDALSRLKQVSEPTGKTTRYTYDKAGNRESETILASDVIITENIYNYNDQNRLSTVTTKASGAADVITEYRYDGNGNELSITVNGTETARNTYDKLNRLISTNANSREVTNTYNGEGQRVAKAVNGTVTRYLYEYDKVVLETDGAGTQTARNVYGTNLLTKTADGQKYYYMYNGHADVTALINANGQIAGTYYYDAFGNIQEHTGIDSNMTYAGYQYDKETGLYYLNARMYDPKIARFLQEDTYTGDRNDPLSLNLYTYVMNNPLRYYDPSGNMAILGEDQYGDIRYNARSGNIIYGDGSTENIYTGAFVMSAPREREEVMRAYDIMEAIETKAKFLAELYSVDTNELGKISGAGFIYGNNSNIMQNTIRNTEHEVYNLQMGLYENKAVQTNSKLLGTIGYALYSGALFDSDGVSGLEGQLRSNTKYDQIIDAEVTKRNLKDDKEILSIGLSFTPGVFAIKDGIDLYQGKNFITGQKMSSWDKGFIIAGMVLPVAAKLKGLKVAKGFAGAADDVARGVSKAGLEESQTITRILPNGESVIDVTSLPSSKGINVSRRLSTEEMRLLTRENGVEFALVYERGLGKNGAGGQYKLFSGTSNRVEVPINKDSMLIYHTHPAGSPWASNGDRKVLEMLQNAGSPQRSSQIIPMGSNDITRFDILGTPSQWPR